MEPPLDIASEAAIDALIERDVLGARREIEAALIRNPDSATLREARVRTFLRCSDMPAVAAEADAALAVGPTANLHLYRAIACLHLGRNEAALEALTASLALRAAPRTVELLGRTLHRLGQPAAALRYFQALIDQPQAAGDVRPVAQRERIYALRDLGRWPEADQAARALIAEFQARPFYVASAIQQYDMQQAYHRWSALLDKGDLAQHLNAWQDRHAALPPVWPESFVLPAETDRLARFRASGPPGLIFIVKPRKLYGGQGMRVTREPDPAIAGDAVVQRYIDDPYLIDGRKFHLRLYLLVAAVAPLRVYVYREGIARIAPERYATDDAALDHPAIHVTNTALHQGHPALVISSDATQENVGNIWSLSAVLAHMAQAGIAPDAVWGDIRETARRFIAVAADAGIFRAQAREHARYCFPPRLFGLDLLLDRAGRAWLLEYQRNPAMTGNALVNKINGTLFATVFGMSVYPLLEHANDEARLADAGFCDTIESAREAAARGRFERLI